MPLAFSPMEFAPPPPIEADASGAQALGGMAGNMAGMLANKMGGGPGAGSAGAAMANMMGQPTDAPLRRKTPMAMMEPNYA